MSGQNERSSPAVMQYIGGKTEVVWPARLRTADPVLPWPKTHSYSNQYCQTFGHRGHPPHPFP
jgi:branched-chain amino acid transport system substrate-binding protein